MVAESEKSIHFFQFPGGQRAVPTHSFGRFCPILRSCRRPPPMPSSCVRYFLVNKTHGLYEQTVGLQLTTTKEHQIPKMLPARLDLAEPAPRLPELTARWGGGGMLPLYATQVAHPIWMCAPRVTQLKEFDDSGSGREMGSQLAADVTGWVVWWIGALWCTGPQMRTVLLSHVCAHAVLPALCYDPPARAAADEWRHDNKRSTSDPVSQTS